MSKTWGRCRSGKIPKCSCPTHSWPLNTADLRYSNTASFKTSSLSHTCLSYQHKSKSKSADVSYPVFQREKHLTWSPILYEDNVLYPTQPHQIIMRSKIFNPQEHSWENFNRFFFSHFLKSRSFWKVPTVCLCGVRLTYLPVEGSPGGRDPGLRTGELAGLQSSGKGLGMAGRDDVLSCCSSSCNLLDNWSRTEEEPHCGQTHL